MVDDGEFAVKSVQVDGYEVKCYVAGSGEEAVLCLNGGPGLPCDYLRDAHLFLAAEGFQIVAFDQLGCGASAKPDDPNLWTISRYVEEVETVRQQLGLGKVHLLGHSWGGWLSVEYMTRYAENVRSLILADTCANIPHLQSELMRLRDALGAETQAMMLAREADGTLHHPEYEAAVTILTHRHVCRLPGKWPESLLRSLGDWNVEVYGAMQGPNEFLYTGNLRDWNRWDALPGITCPVLIVVGRHDEITPACAREMGDRIENATTIVFPNSSHMPFYEEPDAYRERLLRFLKAE